MKYLVGVFAATLVVAGLYPTVDKEKTDKQEQFAMELENCREAMASGVPNACDLYGKIEIVDNHGDVTVERVDNHGDLRVQWVDNFPDGPGKWERVDNHADYQVELVDNHGDYSAEFVDNFPGCN